MAFGKLSVRLRSRRFTPGAGPAPTQVFQLSITAAEEEYTEGETISFSIALDTRGYTRVITDPPIVVYVQRTGTMTNADYDQSTAARLAAAVSGVTGAAYLQEGALHKLTLAYNFVGPLVVTRPTLDDGVAEDPETAGLQLYNATVGPPHNVAITTDEAIVDLVDAGGAAPAPTISLSASSIMEGSVNGTLVGLFTSSAGGTPTFTLTHVDGIAIDGTDFFKIASVNQLQAGTVQTDYETKVIHSVTVTSSDGGGPTTFNVSVIDVAETAGVYVVEAAHDGFYVSENAPAGFVIADPLMPTGGGTITSRTILRFGTYRFPDINPTNHETTSPIRNDNPHPVAEVGKMFEFNGAALRVRAGHSVDFFEDTGMAGWFYADSGTGTPWYNIDVRFVRGGVNVDQSFKIRPIYKAIVPQSTAGLADDPIANVNDFRTKAINPANNRHIRVPATVIGYQQYANPVGTSPTFNITADNLVFTGHPRFIAGRNTTMRVDGGNNITFRDLAVRVGTSGPGSPYGARDSFNMDKGQNVVFENCSFSWATDENGNCGGGTPRVPRNKKIQYYRCLFTEPSFAALHSDPGEAQHPYGLKIDQWQQQIEILECIFIGNKARSPLTQGPYGAYIKNCFTQSSVGGFRTYQFSQYMDKKPAGGTHIFDHNITGHTMTWKSSYTANEEVHYDNEWLLNPNNPGTPNQGWNYAGAVKQSLPPRSQAPTWNIQYDQGGTAAAFRTYRPFKISSTTGRYAVMDISTAAGREALFEHLFGATLGVVGVRARDSNGDIIKGDAGLCEIDKRVIQNFRTQTSYTGSGAITASRGMTYIEGPEDTCAVGSSGDACRLVQGYVTGAPG